MKRRELMTLTSLAAAPLLAPVVPSAQELYKEGAHYQRLPEKVPTSSEDKIEVVEVFWYGCPHCFRFEPVIHSWLQRKPDNVEFVRIPGAGGRWDLGAQAYYVAKRLGILEQSHEALFDAIHVHGKRITSLDDVAEFYQQYGVDREAFDKALNSFEVKKNLQQAKELMRRYQITGVPSLIVNGQYKTNSLDVVDYLVQKES